MGNLWRDKSCNRLRNIPANLKCVVCVTTSPGLPVDFRDTHLHMCVAGSCPTCVVRSTIKVPWYRAHCARVEASTKKLSAVAHG